MGQNVVYPDNSVLTSTALTVQEIQAVLQVAVCGMLGITDSVHTTQVRIEYGTAGQPSQQVSDDVCYLRCMPNGTDPYSRIRERSNSAGDDDTSLIENWTYTNVWSAHFCFYGPNSYDRARAVRSAFYQDYFTDLLGQNQLFPVSDFPEPVRAPEVFDGQWWERADMEFVLYEFVQETISRQTVASVEVIVSDADGEIADVTIEPNEVDGGPFTGGQTTGVDGGLFSGGQTLVTDGGPF
jgi:hypothetical protein